MQRRVAGLQLKVAGLQPLRNYPLDCCNHLILLPLCNYAGGVGETRWWNKYIREVKVGVRDLSTVDLARELLERVEASSESHSPGPERGTRTVVNDLGLHVIKVTQ